MAMCRLRSQLSSCCFDDKINSLLTSSMMAAMITEATAIIIDHTIHWIANAITALS